VDSTCRSNFARRAPLAAFEREGPRRGQRRPEGVSIRGARRFSVSGAQRDQARIPAPRAQVPSGRQQGGACGCRCLVAILYAISRNIGCNDTLTLLVVEFMDFVNAGQCPGEVPANQARVQHSDELRKPIQVREQQFRLVLGLQVQGEQVNRGRRAVLWVWYRNPLLFCYPEMCS
jgi:hypothetical protein